jgi:hypothetical protein
MMKPNENPIAATAAPFRLRIMFAPFVWKPLRGTPRAKTAEYRSFRRQHYTCRYKALRGAACKPHAVLVASLEISALQFLHHVVAGADAQGHDGKGWILAGRGGKTRSVQNKKVLDVMALLELVEDRRLGIVAHTSDTDFMDGPAGAASGG